MITKTKKETLRWYVYVPHGWGHTFSKENCAFSVHDTGRGVGFHQCSRKIKETVEGYGWCAYHARILKDALSGK